MTEAMQLLMLSTLIDERTVPNEVEAVWKAYPDSLFFSSKSVHYFDPIFEISSLSLAIAVFLGSTPSSFARVAFALAESPFFV